MDIWKSKVLPKIKLVFAKSGGKKAAAAAELVKSFDESKEGINGEFEEKKADLQPKVVEIYESVPAPLKVLIKERSKVSGIKKNSAAITKFFEELAKIEFPGAKQVSEGISKVGPALLSGPIFATFEKVSSLLPVAAEEAPKEAPVVAAAAAEEAAEKKDAAAAEAPAGEKKEEAPAAVEEKKEEAAPAAAEETAAAAETAPPAADAPAAEPAAEAAPAEAAAPAEPAAKAEEETPKA
ncbi:plasma membrane-associated cation-binding protein 1-like [Panicum virgatum]|uniref:Plasma membrane-associated cation-binding protein 1 n=1 Tax=Panicum virgatum TaxID=38727 RepID=A0A8T0X8H5_PANVG|nr:plasma membrane-associated cation-binding protein 1-like [Panicum virgatum]KAG2657862.1 hypothetical protein PVAP13_1KG138800 [Panicum virgatum]